MKIRYKIFLTGIVLSLLEIPAWGQDLFIKKISEPITIDGVMDEEAWKQSDIADRFMQFFPFDSSLSVMQTEVRAAYDDENLYIFAIMHSPSKRDKYVTPSLRRDYRGRAFDGFSVQLDTYKDKTNAFNFGLNPFGVQREALVSDGGNFSGRRGGGSFSLTWDNKWYSAAKIYDDYWVAEMSIPFKTLRYKENLDSWFVNFYRIDSDDGEISTWSPIPRNLSPINLAFNKEMKFDGPLQSPGRNISLIPFSALKVTRDFENQVPTTTGFSAGGDAKIALSSAMNLDLTFNPDFSQVEVDQQVTDLDRFEIFFPERRQFFLENADLFASFGSFSARPFFSRRIGVAIDTATGTNLQNPLYFGARPSGKINNDWRVGLMTIQAAKDEEISLPSINYTVASVQRKIWDRSNISAIIVNKQAFQDSLRGDFTTNPANWNRTLGLDFNFASADSKWSGKAYYHRTWDQDAKDSTYSANANASLNTFRWSARTTFRTVGANFNPEVGFVRRRDFLQNASTVNYKIYPSRGSIQVHGPGLDYDILGNERFGVTDWDANFLYNITFLNTSSFSLRMRRQYTYLTRSFDASGSGDLKLPADTEYWYNFIIARFNSDQRKPFFFNVSTSSGEYYNGTRINLGGSLTYRFQPYGFISMDFQYNRIRLPDPYSDSDLYLIGPRIDITFNKDIFWTTFVQYNNQINNLNINSRLQWRYAPVSDLFIVYTDNYLTDINGRFVDFSAPRSRFFVVKLTYWLNL